MTERKGKTLCCNPDIVYREEEDGAFLFHPETGELKCLNIVGSAIWRLCNGENTVANLEEIMKKIYPQVPTEQLHKDLISFLDDLMEIGYLQYGEGVP